MNSERSNVSEITDFLVKKGFPKSVDATIILGSGLGSFGEQIDSPVEVLYRDIPNFPDTSVQGHSGKLISGLVENKRVLTFSGRFHHYEGHSFSKTIFPVQLANAFNTKKLIISNAAGAINRHFSIGDLMVIDDIFRPFQNINPTSTSRYKYNLEEYAITVQEIAASIGLDVQRGTYLFAKGPNYETKAEIRAFEILGADVVGMSTAPELMEASYLGIKTVAISMITNMAAGISKGALSHDEVKKAADTRKDDFARLVSELIIKL